ncbi:putative isoaspartyl peptidase/L-asparaginase [Escovopsis weberi]|uniref:Putative isoaspartyl peptidase/L-asparaginase n=1 Tax=Escovopsis weberi TaxID=150374 RepID=A0A0M9VWI3_ESCWE|nr:putative isoaspartyl peptidase/L-asparaginase [Escovopsis weberi]
MKPRIIIHGGAGNIIREGYPAEKYQAYRTALLSIVANTAHYMNSVIPSLPPEKSSSASSPFLDQGKGPSALEIATHAVTQLEDNALFNSGHGAVFTRDGVNELEASVMVSRGAAKRAVGVMGLRRVRNPILLARRILEHGEQDLAPRWMSENASVRGNLAESVAIDIPSAQGHSQLHGKAAEALARRYGLEMVDPAYFFTQQRWDEHVRALERERRGAGTGTWDAGEHLPQGTVGAVALDGEGVVCVATSTGGMTNKLTGRIGDTPSIGAGFWAEEWVESGRGEEPTAWDRALDLIRAAGGGVTLAGPLKGFLADCLPAPWLYSPLSPGVEETTTTTTTTTRSMAISGTGNGDSFLRTSAARTAAAMARWRPEPGSEAVRHVAGRGGELQRSAGDRWGRTGEGEGGMIGIESVVVRDAAGRVLDARSEILMDFNCGGMYRAWADEDGKVIMSVWTNGSWDDL